MNKSVNTTVGQIQAGGGGGRTRSWTKSFNGWGMLLMVPETIGMLLWSLNTEIRRGVIADPMAIELLTFLEHRSYPQKHKT